MPTVLETRHVKATRKPWQCDGCGRKFPAGTPKERQRNIGDDGPYTWEACTTCSGIVAHLSALEMDFYDGITEEHIYEDMMERFGSWEAADAHYTEAAAGEEKTRP